MKHTIIALILSCLITGTANAANGLLLVNAAINTEESRDFEVAQRVLERLNVHYTLVPVSLVTRNKAAVDSLAVCKVNLYGSTWVEFDGVFIPGIRRSAVASIDSLATLVSRPHTKPFLLTADRSNSNSWLTTAGSCSTGVGTGSTVSSATNCRGYDPRTWRIFNIRLGTSYVRTATEASFGMLRRLIGRVSVNQVNGENYPATSMVERPDTVLVWTRQFADVDTGTPWVLAHISAGVAPRYLTAAPTIFCSLNESGQQGHTVLLASALAYMDSLASGNILAGSRPLRFAMLLQGATAWGGSSVSSMLPSDTLAAKPFLTDSIPSFKVPVGFSALPESINVASKAYAIPWFASSVYYPIPESSIITPNGNASSDYPTDITAYTRNRQAYDDGTCDAPGDTSISCLLRYAIGALRTAWPNKEPARVIVGAGGGQWRPIAGASTDLVTVFGSGRMGADSLMSAFASAGFMTVLSNSREAPWWNTSILPHDGAEWLVRPASDSDTLPGSGKTIRGFTYPTGNALTLDNATLSGRARTDGANDSKVQYQSAGGGSVFSIYAWGLANDNGLGMTTSATTNVGYYEAKWLVDEFKTANSFCWPGHSIATFVRADKLGH